MLLPLIDACLRRTGLTPSRFGREALGDPGFVRDLRNGREPRAETVARVRSYLDRQAAAR